MENFMTPLFLLPPHPELFMTQVMVTTPLVQRKKSKKITVVFIQREINFTEHPRPSSPK